MNIKNSLRLVVVAGGMLGGLPQAFALGTTAGTDINNTATVNYSVGSVAQTPVTGSATFKVDRRILFTVAENGSADTSVVPGATDRVTAFTVTNDTNAPLDIGLAVTQPAGGAGPHGGTDNFNASNVRIYIDVNGDGALDAGDQLVTYLDEVPEGGTRKVLVVADIPAGQLNNDLATVVLTGTAKEPGTAGSAGADVTQTAGADTAGTVDTVFGDIAGPNDIARDGKSSDDDAYKVVTATIAVNKTAKVIDDPFNGTTNPKAIPGATVEYCLVVTNNGAAAATGVTLTDPIPTNTAYVASSVATGTGATCGTTPDAVSLGSESGGTVTVNFGSVANSSSVWATFRVTVQ